MYLYMVTRTLRVISYSPNPGKPEDYLVAVGRAAPEMPLWHRVVFAG